MKTNVAVSHSPCDKTPPAVAMPLGDRGYVRFGNLDFFVPDLKAAHDLAAAINRVYGLEQKREEAA